MDFNINDKVRVKLTDFGRQALELDHSQFWANTTGRPAPYTYTPPKEDAGGWSEWQLWHLMQDLGRHCRIGGKVPFETTIQLLENTPSAPAPEVPMSEPRSLGVEAERRGKRRRARRRLTAELGGAIVENEMKEMVKVTQEDANNYCRVLAALDMEEEGDPVAEIETLMALREKVYRVLDEHTLCGDVETRIRFLLAERERLLAALRSVPTSAALTPNEKLTGIAHTGATMTDEPTLGNVQLSDELSLVLEPECLLVHDDNGAVRCYYERTVMRLLAAERERCASMAENYDLGTAKGHAIAACIRSPNA